MSFHTILAVAAGGALGAVARFLVSFGAEPLLGYWFPFGTFIVNVIGSLALGVLIQLTSLAWSPSAEVRAFLVVGVLGAFTTFSTFSVETVTLLQQGQARLALFNMAIQLGLGLAAAACGLTLGKSL